MSMVAFQLTKSHNWNELANIIEDLEYESLSIEAREALAKPNGACQDILRYKRKVLDWKPPGKSEGPTSVADFKMMTSAELMVFHLASPHQVCAVLASRHQPVVKFAKTCFIPHLLPSSSRSLLVHYLEPLWG